MSPYHNARYGNFLYQAGMIDEIALNKSLAMEAKMGAHIEAGEM